jgi:CUE domain
MSEVQQRPSAPRGRASRGGRGGYSSRGGARGGNRSATNGDSTLHTDNAATSNEDEGEIGQLKKQFSDQLLKIKEMFPDWTDEDIVYALQETDGDLEGTIDRITSGKLYLQTQHIGVLHLCSTP